MKTISHPLFLVLFTLYLIYYVAKQFIDGYNGFISNYLADLLSIFVVNTIALWIVRKLYKKPNYEFPIILVFISVLLFSIFFEYYLPSKSTKYTADIFDVLCYFVSGLGYVLWRWRKTVTRIKK